uniref:Uncharacterized protein n=1 Tax=Anguilla anguilla TaxID=7936 RepID=A0A0E9QXL9_ANGAN
MQFILQNIPLCDIALCYDMNAVHFSNINIFVTLVQSNCNGRETPAGPS